MEMFLSVMTLSLVGVAVSAILFAAATRKTVSTPVLDERLKDIPSRFFVSDQFPQSRPAVPMEVLLLQIERHVRLEQAVAESFHDWPTAETLRTTTTSPLVH